MQLIQFGKMNRIFLENRTEQMVISSSPVLSMELDR